MVSVSRRELVLTSQFLGGLTNCLVRNVELERLDDRAYDNADQRPLVTRAGDW
jgi:hypothetical protein